MIKLYPTCRFKTINTLLVVLLLNIPLVALTQELPFYNKTSTKKRIERRLRRDTMLNRPRFGRAAIELGAAELTPFIIDRYIRNMDYAHISWQTVGHNLKPNSWAWDNDGFQTNQFGHPYHGSLFFNAFRTNGYSFWQSAPVAFVGSYLWETFAENQAPAPNDFINTSLGGIILGEMTYRLSNKIINNHSRGFKRQASEVFALIINPMNGINRILDGKWGKVSRNTTEQDSSKVRAEFDLGLRKFNVNNANVFRSGHFGWFARARLLYGTPFEDFKTPFSNINITAELGKDDSTLLNVVSVYGSITGWKVFTSSQAKHLAILSANYIHNAAFFYGGQSIKFNLYSEFTPTKKLKINTTVGAGPVILGAVPDDYKFQGRNYDYGPGFGINGGGKITVMDHFSAGINYRGGWLITLNGNPSHYFLHAVSSEIGYTFVNNFSIFMEPGFFSLKGIYNNYPDVNRTYPYLRLSARYAITQK